MFRLVGFVAINVHSNRGVSASSTAESVDNARPIREYNTDTLLNNKTISSKLFSCRVNLYSDKKSNSNNE